MDNSNLTIKGVVKMRVGIRQRPQRMLVRDLEARNIPYVYCEINGKRGFIVGPKLVIESIKKYDFIYVSLFEYVDVSIMEQHKQMMMGRIVTRKKQEMRNYRARVIGKSQSNQPHYVWDIV